MEVIKLKSINILEERGGVTEYNARNIPLSHFNLLVGDNAQGKTRLFNTMHYMTSTAYNLANILATTFKSKWIFQVQSNSDTEEVVYDIKVKGSNGKNVYTEKITRNKKMIFSSSEKYLYNESSRRKITNYYIPENIPAIVSINEKGFHTIKLIRDYFQRIIYVSSNKSRDLHVDPQSIVPNKIGTNLASVLVNWEKNYPQNFQRVVNEFKDNYPFIKKFYFTDQKTLEGIKAKLLTITERNVLHPITQQNWSDGLYRMLFLLMSTKVPFVDNEKIYSPSFIMVDEIENGLDYKSLKFIIDYLKDYSDEVQIALSTHSPLVCELIHPENWIIVKRHGTKVNFISPPKFEKKLNEELELFKHKHWDFYTKHISNSNLYLIK